MAREALKLLQGLLAGVEHCTPPERMARLWLAQGALLHPALAPYLLDSLLPLEGAFWSLDSQQRALEHALARQPTTEACIGMIWGALYYPARQKALPCRVAVVPLPQTEPTGWFAPVPVAPVSPDVAESAERALTEALRLIERAGLVPPRPVALVYRVEQGDQIGGDSLGLALFLATLSALVQLPIPQTLGATGALAEESVLSVSWVAEKASALEAIGVSLLSPSSTPTLAEAAAQALVGGAVFQAEPRRRVPPLVPEPTFLVAELEQDSSLLERERIEAFEGTVCAALERCGGFLYRVHASVEEGIRAVFAIPEEACQAAAAVQQALYRRQWPHGASVPLARIGIYRGSAERLQEGYLGEAPRMAALLMQAAQPGQILLPLALAPTVELPMTRLGTHRLRDLASVVELCQLDPPDTPICTLAPRTLRLRNHNLPLEPNSLLGREVELASIRSLLESGRRLVTLTGPGGVGKTRLALQVAAELTETFPDGVWFVPVAEVSGEEQLVTAIADAMGLAVRDSRVNFVDALAERRALVVLDNFESILDCAPRVAQLLREAPGLVCLITSQALLSLTGESRFEVAALTPDEASQLFVERARQASPALTLGTEDYAIIAQICQRLESMPLAIELAAARLRMFSLSEIEQRLDDALSLLVTRTRDVPERQRTLRGALEWSYNLLDSTERQHFLRLSLLPGSFLPAAAALVCEEGNILDGLCALEDKSLLRREGNGRWRMLNLVRQFAQERLSKMPDEAKAAQDGLIQYCREIAQNANKNLDSPGEGKKFDIVEADFELVRLVVDILRQNKSDMLVDLLLDLDFFLRRRRYLNDLYDWFKFVCDYGLFGDMNKKGRLLYSIFIVLKEKGDQDAISCIDESIEIGKMVLDESLYADAISAKGILLVRNGDLDEAIRLYEISKEIYARINDDVNYVRVINSYAQALIRQSKLDEAERYIEETVSICKRNGYTRDLIVSMSSQGLLFHEKRDSEGVKNVSIEIIKLCILMNDVLPFYRTLLNFMIKISLSVKVDPVCFYLVGDGLKNIGDINAFLYLKSFVRDLYGVLNWDNEIYDCGCELRDLVGVWKWLQKELEKTFNLV